ncbi:MAG: DUF4124 domain-containing protein [Pseudorhodoferax sp.]
MALPVPAAGQWMWRDANGKPVFSDRSPPPEVPEQDILRRPSGVRPPAAPASATAPSAPTAAASAASGQDPQLEQRRQQAEAAEAARQKAAQEAQAKARAENCARARQSKANLDSGMRIARVNAQGEREFLDDAARAAETQRVQDVIARDCAPLADQ